MHKVPPVSNSVCVIPISLQQMHSTNLNMDMNTPFSQLLHKNSFLSNTTELHAWMRKINLSIIKLDCVKIVKLFTFEIRKKNPETYCQSVVTMYCEFLQCPIELLLTQNVQSIHKCQMKTKALYDLFEKNLFSEMYSSRVLIVFVCVCVIEDKDFSNFSV